MDKLRYKHNAEFLIVQIGPEYPVAYSVEVSEHNDWFDTQTRTDARQSSVLMISFAPTHLGSLALPIDSDGSG